jgi:hypothetical protein
MIKFKAQDRSGKVIYSTDGIETSGFSYAYAMLYFWSRIESGTLLLETVEQIPNPEPLVKAVRLAVKDIRKFIECERCADRGQRAQKTLSYVSMLLFPAFTEYDGDKLGAEPDKEPGQTARETLEELLVSMGATIVDATPRCKCGGHGKN